MRHVTLSMDDKAYDTARALTEKYGAASSMSSVVRRAIALLDEHWRDVLDGAPHKAMGERDTMTVEFLSKAQRGRATW